MRSPHSERLAVYFSQKPHSDIWAEVLPSGEIKYMKSYQAVRLFPKDMWSYISRRDRIERRRKAQIRRTNRGENEDDSSSSSDSNSGEDDEDEATEDEQDENNSNDESRENTLMNIDSTVSTENTNNNTTNSIKSKPIITTIVARRRNGSVSLSVSRNDTLHHKEPSITEPQKNSQKEPKADSLNSRNSNSDEDENCNYKKEIDNNAALFTNSPLPTPESSDASLLDQQNNSPTTTTEDNNNNNTTAAAATTTTSHTFQSEYGVSDNFQFYDSNNPRTVTNPRASFMSGSSLSFNDNGIRQTQNLDISTGRRPGPNNLFYNSTINEYFNFERRGATQRSNLSRALADAVEEDCGRMQSNEAGDHCESDDEVYQALRQSRRTSEFDEDYVLEQLYQAADWGRRGNDEDDYYYGSFDDLIYDEDDYYYLDDYTDEEDFYSDEDYYSDDDDDGECHCNFANCARRLANNTPKYRVTEDVCGKQNVSLMFSRYREQGYFTFRYRSFRLQEESSIKSGGTNSNNDTNSSTSTSAIVNSESSSTSTNSSDNDNSSATANNDSNTENNNNNNSNTNNPASRVIIQISVMGFTLPKSEWFKTMAKYPKHKLDKTTIEKLFAATFGTIF